MFVNVGGLGFEHQLGNIDMGRTFQGAHLAVDAQIGNLADLGGGERVRVCLGLEQMT